MEKSILQQLQKVAKAENKEILQRFFKTGPGEYGEGDIFLGVKVPESRKIAKTYTQISLAEVEKILKSEFHEMRFCALAILNEKYKKTKNLKERDEIILFYLNHTKYINNRDLVDCFCGHILGEYIHETKKSEILYKLASSSNLREQRIAVVSNRKRIRYGEFEDCLHLCEMFLSHPHDLMHKACGRMLREIGKKDEETLLSFLEKYSPIMPRTMLRYAIEKLPESTRKEYLMKKAT